MSDYSITRARYAKGMMAVRTPSDTGYKTRAAYLAEALANGRYTGRENAWIMGPNRAALFERFYAAGWNASPFTYLLDLHSQGDRKSYTIKEAATL